MTHAVKTTIVLVPPRFQVLCMMVTIVVMSLAIVSRLGEFLPKDTIPTVQKPAPSSASFFAGLTETIDVGLYIDNFNKFDITKNEFIANCKLWFVLNPGTVPLDVLGKFDVKRGTVIERSTPIVKMLEDKLFVQYNIQVDFSTQLDFFAYPLDDHYISIQIVNDFIASREALFVTMEQNFTVNPAIKNYGWKLVGKEANAGYIDTNFDPEDPQKASTTLSAVFSLSYSFVGLRFAMSIFLPLMIVFFVSLFCLSFRDIARIGIAVGSVTALLAYRFVIDSISPTVGYFMLSDYLFFAVLASTFVVFFLIVLDSFGYKVTLLTKQVIIGLLHILLLAMVIYLIFR